MKKLYFALFSSFIFTATAQANVINNAEKATLEHNTVSYFAQPKLSVKSSHAFIQNHQFMDSEANNIWHSPIHIADDQEEADLAMPVLLALKQQEVVVAVAGVIENDLLNRLQALPNVRCTQTTLQDAQIEQLTICSHQTASKAAVKNFNTALIDLIYNSN